MLSFNYKTSDYRTKNIFDYVETDAENLSLHRYLLLNIDAGEISRSKYRYKLSWRYLKFSTIP